MKVDLKKQIETYKASHGRFSVVTVPALQFLMIDGHGDPNTSPGYRDALTTIYPVAYKLKFYSKQELGRDYTVMPLEGLWWAEDMDTFTSARDKSRWEWTLMNMVPDWLTQDQTLHIGPYDDEGPVLAEMHNSFIPGESLMMSGKHHEIYLSDPRRTASEKLRTILRQPVRVAGSVRASRQ